MSSDSENLPTVAEKQETPEEREVREALAIIFDTNWLYVNRGLSVAKINMQNMLTQMGPDHLITKATLAMYNEFPALLPNVRTGRSFKQDYVYEEDSVSS